MKRPPRAVIAFLAVVLVVAVAMAALWLRHSGGGLAVLPGIAGATPAAALTPQPPLSAVAGHSPGPLPTSLEGTDAPAIRVDAGGNLVIETALRDLFEYYLSALGEEDIDAVRARLAAHLTATLPPAAAERAWQVFGDYLQYRAGLADLPAMQPGDPDTARARLDAMSTLRRSRLGNEVAQAFFGDEEAYDRFTVERLAVEQDDSLGDDAKVRRITQLEAALPPDLLAARRDSVAITEVGQTVEQLRQSGASDTDIRNVREKALGSAAADRLAELDREEAEWNARYAEYSRQRDAINAAAISVPDREAQVQALRGRLFDAQESIRVDALDRIAAGTAH